MEKLYQPQGVLLAGVHHCKRFLFLLLIIISIGALGTLPFPSTAPLR
jgi:hypothetical protein